MAPYRVTLTHYYLDNGGVFMDPDVVGKDCTVQSAPSVDFEFTSDDA